MATTNILFSISRGKRPRHIFALIYDTDGVGKSTFCSHAPNPIFVGAEKGTEQLDVARFPQTETISELLAELRALQDEKHEFQTVVIDSLDWIEPLIWKAVCEVGPGQALCILRGAVHRFDNLGSQDVKALCVITPAALGPQYFRECAEVIDATAGGAPDRARLAEIMRRHGLTPAAPQA